MAQGTLTCVVGWLDVLMSNKLPQPFATLVQFSAHTHEQFVVAANAAQQQTLHFAADRSHATDKSGATDSVVAVIAPVFEQLAGHAPQAVSMPPRLIVTLIGQQHFAVLATRMPPVCGESTVGQTRTVHRITARRAEVLALHQQSGNKVQLRRDIAMSISVP
jgi:hypothetical protein